MLSEDGQVAGEKLTAALGTSKMAIALGLSMLRKVNVIDWYAEDGLVYLEQVGTPNGSLEELPEFRQLQDLLIEIDTFRKWCVKAELKEIQLATMPNQIGLMQGSINEGFDDPSSMQTNMLLGQEVSFEIESIT